MLDFYRSTIGKKILMAVSGIIGILFLVLHMVGNLQIFEGAEKINNYGAILHGPLSEVVLAQRVVLIGAVLVHILMAYQLTMRARAARPEAYVQRHTQVATLASRSMRVGGVLLLLFIPFHIMHFTTGTIRPAGTFVDGDIYANVLAGFRVPWVTAFYVASMIALGLHLYHGVWSSARTLGFAQPSRHPLHRRIALILSVALWLGFTIVPVAVAAGWVR
ncbi:MAG: succinate dehydrogenase cytochrome b subunit [Gemmatimonadales bacterium]|nr:succinate dehydrogenase cytochrome b subunit [Gemmatimonadales bacterium]